MNTPNSVFDEKHVLDELKHYLPSQAPLKDFIHHNTLHAFQHYPFHEGIKRASTIFGYQVYLSLETYRQWYKEGKINPDILKRIVSSRTTDLEFMMDLMLNKEFNSSPKCEIGKIRNIWKNKFHFNPDKDVHPYLFRLIGNYLDQGISHDDFPIDANGFLSAVRILENNSFGGVFKSKRVKRLLLNDNTNLEDLLKILVGNENYFERYLFDQQFAHPGWSGMVAVLEENPNTLLKSKKVSLKDFIFVELLMEIESLDLKKGEGSWEPLIEQQFEELNQDIFYVEKFNESFAIQCIWQEALEWSYYDQVLAGIKKYESSSKIEKSFQALLCIDDRECSFRRYLESTDEKCETFSAAGFFNVEFYFQPESGKYFTKSCPAPLTPNYLIKESAGKSRHQKDIHFSKHNSSVIGGLISSSTLGLFAGWELAKNIFYPSETRVNVSAKNHMDDKGNLSIQNKSGKRSSHNLQIGFTIEEMADRMESLLKTIGLVSDFAPLIYIIGHGASSVNNTHFAGYDCGACSGRAGSVNARVASWMLNNHAVRNLLAARGIIIPNRTQFIGALHDTTKDDIYYYDLDILENGNIKNHITNSRTFETALHKNSKERSRRFLMINSNDRAEKIHEKVRLRSLSLFEPRPEWNHATNCLCIVGKREITKHLFLDRRAFLQSYDYKLDTDGKLLLGIMRAIAPVCGGINLEYYFSRNDNYRLGAGTKLPHNVMGLIGVANGMDGDLRTGLPYQMINIHDPLRLMVLVHQYPEEIINTLKMHPPTFEWFINNWIHLCCLHPDTKEILRFSKDKFIPYETISEITKHTSMDSFIESEFENLPVMQIN